MGLFSGGHCLGMCGPLVLALPVSQRSTALSVLYRVLYNSGRVFTYTLLGAVTGLLGLVFELQSLQARIAYIAGFLLILVAVLQLLPYARLTWLSQLHSALLKIFAPLTRRPGPLRFVVLGMLNGILPCGMVAAALMVSLASETTGMSMLYMLFFGLGTFPLMLAASLFGMYISPRLRQVLSWAGPIYAIGLGILLILRPSLIAPHCVQ